MNRLSLVVLLASLVLPVSSHAFSEELSPRGTAHVAEKGSWSVGVFGPLKVAVRDGLELELHPLFALASPHVTARVAHGGIACLWLTGEYGISVPTPGLRLLKGTFFPEWSMSDENIGWFLVPSAALLVSRGEESVTTMRLGLALGVPVGQNDAIPLDSYAPLDLLLAPALTGMRLRFGVAQDHRLSSRLRGRAGADVWLVGASPDPPRSRLYVSARAGLDVALGASTRLAVGAAWFNSDQRRTIIRVDEDGFATRVPRRSNDFFPTLDLVWER